MSSHTSALNLLPGLLRCLQNRGRVTDPFGLCYEGEGKAAKANRTQSNVAACVDEPGLEDPGFLDPVAIGTGLLAGPVDAAISGALDRVATAEALDAASTEQLTDAARKLYPKKHGTELHHVIPKYLGGPADGKTVPLDAAYHQMITNEFRHLWNYGQAKPDASAVVDIAKRVYTKYPIP